METINYYFNFYVTIVIERYKICNINFLSFENDELNKKYNLFPENCYT